MNVSNLTIEGICNHIKTELHDLYPEREIQSLTDLIFQEVLNFSKVDLFTRSTERVDDNHVKQIKEITSHLKEFVPIQYIFGKTEFYSLPFKVNKNVLIPRQETEELVDWIIHEAGNSIVKILDIGTGSGCIAISLNKNIFRSKVDAIEISEEAIELAKMNSILNNAFVNFIKADILQTGNFTPETKYDIIVSNPPYVKISEKELMSRNVLDYEPHLALFVPDDNPLVYYQVIADFAKEHLKENGKLFFEINETMSQEIKKLLAEKHFKNIEVRKDINGKYRMAMAIA